MIGGTILVRGFVVDVVDMALNHFLNPVAFMKYLPWYCAYVLYMYVCTMICNV